MSKASTAQVTAVQESAPLPENAGTASSLVTPGRPSSLLDVQEPATDAEANVVYPTGAKLWFTVLSVMTSCVIYGLDLTIIAVAVPSVTNDFKSIKDIGWYTAVYGLVGSALAFFWSKCYTLWPVKIVYMFSIAIFEIGALLATVAPSSKVLIFARAISGAGGCGMGNGGFIVMTHCFPNKDRPKWMGIVGMVQTASMVTAPLIGGALIAAFNWRACFGINIPLGALVLVLIYFGFNSPIVNTEEVLPLKKKLLKLDPLGTMVFMPAVVSAMLALQWGGMTYGWSDARIVVLLVVSVVLLAIFGYIQYRLQDDAILPPRIAKNRNIIAGVWFEVCCDGTLAITEYYIAIYFQGVRGFSAFKSGYLGVPMIVGLSAAALVAGFGTSRLGYYVPFMFATAVLGPIASGLLTTLDLDTQLAKVVVLLGLIGIAVGLGIQAPASAITTVLDIKDVPIGMGVIGFGARLGASLFVSSSATLFQNRLTAEVDHFSPGTNVTILKNSGLSDIRHVIGQDRLRDVLLGYGEAISQTLYFPVALTCLSLLSCLAMEWRSVKTKQE